MDSSSARDRGITADGVADIMAADSTADMVMRAADLKGVVRQAASMAKRLVAQFAVAACRTVVAGSTVAADAGNGCPFVTDDERLAAMPAFLFVRKIFNRENSFARLDAHLTDTSLMDMELAAGDR